MSCLWSTCEFRIWWRNLFAQSKKKNIYISSTNSEWEGDSISVLSSLSLSGCCFCMTYHCFVFLFNIIFSVWTFFFWEREREIFILATILLHPSFYYWRYLLLMCYVVYICLVYAKLYQPICIFHNSLPVAWNFW